MTQSIGDRGVIPSLEFKSPNKVIKPFGSAVPRFRYPDVGGSSVDTFKTSGTIAGAGGEIQESHEEWKPDGTYS